MTDILTQLSRYRPVNEQESADREEFLKVCRKEWKQEPSLFDRRRKAGHITVSAWITNRERNKIVLAYHRLYDSWAWLGGHADQERDLLQVAVREAGEESGLAEVTPVTEEMISLEILSVNGHRKQGRYVSSHVHYNVTYLLEADETAPLRHREEEHSAVGWFAPADAIRLAREPWYGQRIYPKLNKRLEEYR